MALAIRDLRAGYSDTEGAGEEWPRRREDLLLDTGQLTKRWGPRVGGRARQI
jgi:hypothetical protein